MSLSEQVTFGASGLDRAAGLRRDAQALPQAADARAIVLWRGRLLLRGESLARVPLSQSALAGASRVFLGREPEPTFACAIDDWEGSLTDGDGGPGRPSDALVPHPTLPGDGFADLRAVMARLSARDAELAATARALFEWHRTHQFCARCGAPSALDQAGWRRLCSACGGAHFPRTDPVVIMLVTHGNNVLVGRSPGWPERMYSLLAGFIEPGETLEAAARREVWEEVGIRCGRVEYLTSQPWPFPSSLMIGCRAEALSTSISRDPVEIEDAVWMRRERMSLALAGRDPECAPARSGSIARFLLDNWVADRRY